MTIPKFDQLTGNESLPQLIEMVAKLQKQVQWLMDGKVSSNNVREIGGYNVNDTDLKSVDGDVGLSSADDAADPVRLWAGDEDKDAAPWIVYKSGKMVATGALIQSSDGTYPKVILDPDNDLLGAYSAVDKYVQIKALDGTTSTPAIIMRDGSIPLTATIYLDNLLNELSIGANGNIQISALPGGDVRISGNLIRFPNWSNIYSSGAAQTLQTALNNKANGSGLSRTVYVALTSGGPATSPMTISNGIVTS